MKILIKEKLSQHKSLTPEGYLICTDAILARTGKQEYRKSELWQDASDDVIEVDRKPEEVFDDATIASFENKPITIEHPDEDVTSSNWKEYQVGFVRDVRRGTDNGQDVLIGNLIIQDKDAIDLIQSGQMTELSCGYNCDIKDEDEPQQRNIRGNHVALCEQGRAGNARIIDSKVKDDNIFYGGIKESDLRKSKDFKIKEYLEELDDYRKDKNPKKEFYNRNARDITNDINKRLKQIEHLPNNIFDSRIADVKYVVCNEDDELGRFDTVQEAKQFIKELKQFDKRNHNPFSEKYTIEVEDAIKDGWSGVRENGVTYSYHNGYYYITHNSGKVEKIDASQFKNLEELYSYVDKINDSIKDSLESDVLNAIDNFKSSIKVNSAEEFNKVRQIAEKKGITAMYNERTKRATFVYDSKIHDSLDRDEQELCDYVLSNLEGDTPEDLLDDMRVYYSSYAELARKKPDEVLKYFERNWDDRVMDSVKDSKIKDEKKIYVRQDDYVYDLDNEYLKSLMKKYVKSGWYTKSQYTSMLNKLENDAKANYKANKNDEAYDAVYKLSYMLSFDELLDELDKSDIQDNNMKDSTQSDVEYRIRQFGYRIQKWRRLCSDTIVAYVNHDDIHKYGNVDFYKLRMVLKQYAKIIGTNGNEIYFIEPTFKVDESKLKDRQVNDNPDMMTRSGRQEKWMQVMMSSLDELDDRYWNMKGSKVDINNNAVVLVVTENGVELRSRAGFKKVYTSKSDLASAIKTHFNDSRVVNKAIAVVKIIKDYNKKIEKNINNR